MSAQTLLGGGRTRSRDGTEIGYLTLGPDPGSEGILVCTHGAFSTGAEWMPVAELLADRYRLVLMDRRGHGGSGGPGGALGGEEALREESEDLEAVVDAVAPHGGVTLLGHSFGACIALAECLRTGGPRCDRVAAIEPPLVQDVTESDVARFRGLLKGGAYEQAVTWGFQDVQRLGPKGLDRMRRNRKKWAEVVAAAPMMLRHWEMGLALPAPERFTGLNTPTLLMFGTRSDERPFLRSTRLLAAALPDARLEELEGHNHLSMSRDPEPVAKAIRRFLA